MVKRDPGAATCPSIEPLPTAPRRSRRLMSNAKWRGSPMNTSVIEGGCLCGAVRYQVTSLPTNSMICHCQTCRKAAASPVVAWVTFVAETFQFTRGRPSEFRSSPAVTRSFCASCGSPLSYRHSHSPSTIDITTCSLDDPERFPPSHHSWLSHDLAWVRFGDGLPAFPEWRHPDGSV